MWNQSEKITAIVHGGCPDGLGAAFAIKTAFPNAVITQHRHHPALPAINTPRVIFADITPKRAELVALMKRLGTENVQVFDHHESAEANLAGLPSCIFDSSRSGEVITWEQLLPGRPVPSILRYVQDRDLWRWEMPDSAEVNAWLGSWERFNSLKRWDALAYEVERNYVKVVAEGAAILRVQRQMVDRLCSTARFAKFAGYSNVPVVNAALLPSEVGNRLLELRPQAPFAVIYNGTTNRTHYELRSRQGGVNVGEIATRLGGGGHQAAAGFDQRKQA